MVSFIWFIFNIIVLFFIFEENGEAGWKSIVPFYGTYTQYKLFYKKNVYWILLVFEILFFVGIFSLVFLGLLVRGVPSYQITDSQGIFFLIMMTLSFISMIALIIIDILFKISLTKKYNKNIWFIIGLIFVEPFMLAYLAWENRGKLKKRKKNG